MLLVLEEFPVTDLTTGPCQSRPIGPELIENRRALWAWLTPDPLELHQVLWSAIIWSGTEDPVKRTFWSSSMLGDFAPRSANTELAGSGDVLRPATASCRRLRVRWGFLNSYAADTTASAALPSHGAECFVASTSASCPKSPPHSKAGLFR